MGNIITAKEAQEIVECSKCSNLRGVFDKIRELSEMGFSKAYFDNNIHGVEFSAIINNMDKLESLGYKVIPDVDYKGINAYYIVW